MNTQAPPRHTADPAVSDVTPDLLARWLADGDTVLVDVREPFEHAEERIDGAVNVPLAQVNLTAIRRAHPGHSIVFHCLSGKRSAQALARCASADGQVFQLAGGLEGWKASGRPTLRPVSAPRVGVMRQVQIAAGTLVLTGTLLGAFVAPAWLALPAFVGTGLAFAGVSGWCGMAVLLARMPWNRGAARPAYAAPSGDAR